MHLTVNVCTQSLLYSTVRGKIHIILFLIDVDGKVRTGKWVLFILPFITVLREGLSSFSQKSKSKD